MPHEVIHEITRTIRGMKLTFKLKAPVSANVEPIIEKVDKLYAWAAKDPDQFDLLEDQKTDPAD